MKNNRVIIVIRKGVIEIYSDIKNLIFDVIDLDTDDPERKEEFNLELFKH